MVFSCYDYTENMVFEVNLFTIYVSKLSLYATHQFLLKRRWYFFLLKILLVIFKGFI